MHRLGWQHVSAASAAMTVERDMRPRSHGSVSPEFCQFVAPSRTEGAGKAGRRLRPHRRVQWVVKNAHGFDRYSRDIPAFPAQWLYGLYVLSPVSGLCCHRCRARTGRPDRRQGRGARTTRLRRTLRRFRLAPKRLTPQASIATRATFRDDLEAPLLAARAGHLIP